MTEHIAKKIYHVAKYVFWPSFVLVLFTAGLVPFDVSVAWGEGGASAPLIFARDDVKASIGDSVLSTFGGGSATKLYTVQRVVRKNGATYYQVFPESGSLAEVTLIRAGEYGRVALGTVPFLGVWVRAISHPIGMMTFVGLPVLMFLINGTLIFLRKILFVVSSVEGRARTIEEETALENMTSIRTNEMRSRHENTTGNNGFGRIVTPFGQGYGM